MTVPPARQCNLSTCEREAVDPDHPGALCQSHLDNLADGEPVGSPEESGGETTRSESSQNADTSTERDALSEAPTVEPGTYPADLRDVDRWLTWKPTDDGRKVPRAPYEHLDWPDRFVSAQDPAVWTTFDEAAEWADALPGYGLAFNIPARDADVDDDHVLIDYDDARDPETGRVHSTVREHLERAESYADVSTSGTGVHIFVRGALPDDVKAVDAPLPETEGFPDAEIEVYDAGRYSAMTGAHIEGTPTETADCQTFLDELADEFATVAEGTPDELTREPEKSATEIADVETTADMQDVLDAIQHTGPRDIRLRSTVTHDRADGSRSLDPSWASSKSGTRLAEVGDGWVYRKGMVGLDALQVVALEERIIASETAYPSGAAFWDAVEALRERGAHVPEYEAEERSVDHTALLPEAERLTQAASGWDWRHAGSEAARDLTVDEARERTTQAISAAYEGGDRVLIEALPTMGKSYGAVKAAAETDTPITVLTGRGRKEQYEQFRQWCEEHDLSYKTLPAFFRDCDTANGEHGDEWRNTVRDWYVRGATPKEIHKSAEYVLDRPLPCQEHEGHTCPYAAKWDFDPDEYDVLIGHYAHAHKRKVTNGRVPVFDEFPDAYETVLGGQLQGAVSYWLSTVDAIPYEDYTDLLEHRDDEQRRSDALAWFLDGDLEPDETQVFDDEQAHAAAPLAAFTILAGENLGNGFETADLGDAGTGVFNRQTGEVSILQPPALGYNSGVRGVVALDGTPTPAMWKLALGTRLTHRPVLADDERATYLQEALNLQLVRTTDAVKPYNSADHVATEQDAALLEAIGETHGGRPSLITTSTAEHEYDSEGVLGLVDETKHYGDVLGSNQFDDTRLGAVIGSNHYGDHFIKKWGAFAGEGVERNDEKGTRLSYGAFGDKVLTHMREHDTLQAAMRFGRDGNGAVVYVHTDTLPEWVPLAGEGRVATTWSPGMRQVLEAVREHDGEWRTAEIAAHPGVEIGVRQVRAHLTTLFEDYDALSRAAEGCGFVWHDDGLHRIGEHGEVELDTVDLDDLTDEESAELARSTIYTWEFRTSSRSSADRGADPGAERSEPTAAAANGGEPPPDDPA